MIGIGCVDIGQRERVYVNKVLDSGLITSGPMLDAFESRFAERHGRKHGLMVNSGTDALRIALAALGEANNWIAYDGGDIEVIVPALTFIATSNVVLQRGFQPIFVDVDPKTFNIDPIAIEKAITGSTRAIIVVHLFGLPCDMNSIMDIAKRHNLKVIEDSCESMGVNYRGKPVGSFGDVACFSTYAAHVISTGVGGLAITDDDNLAGIMRSYANHGRNPEFLGFKNSYQLTPEAYQSSADHAEIIKKRFEFQRVGYSCRATQMEAALGLAQLERLDEIVGARRINWEFLYASLSSIPQLEFQWRATDCENASMMFPVVLAGGMDRLAIMLSLEQHGIETRPFFNILGQKPYQYWNEDQYPVAKRLSRQGFYVGCHQLLTQDDLEQIAETIDAVVTRRAMVAA